MGPRPRRSRRGFTLLEMALVVVVIGILAALIYPAMGAITARARVTAEKESLRSIGQAMRKFYEDTGRWPLDSGFWPMFLDVDPSPFGMGDTALFLPSGGLLQCSSSTGDLPCWGGPYLSWGANVNHMGGQVDPWGNPRYFALFVPTDQGTGGASAAPNGAVVIWSAGADGLDATGCTNMTASCTRNINNIVQGLPSVPGADDIIFVVGTAR